MKAGSQLRIDSITTVEGGKYTCCGKSANKALCTSSVVTVQSRMTIETKLQNQTLVASDELILECQILGATDGFRWSYNDVPIPSDNDVYPPIYMVDSFLTVKIIIGGIIEFLEESSRLTYHRLTTGDSGKYTCCGRNNGESACTSSMIIVTELGDDDENEENGMSFAD